MSKEENWPTYKSDLVTIGNPNSSKGICTLWTQKDKILQHIDNNNFIVGQPVRQVSNLVRQRGGITFSTWCAEGVGDGSPA